MQAKRMAFEGAGYRGWRGCDGKYPVFGNKEGGVPLLGGLNIENTEHLRMERQKIPCNYFATAVNRPNENLTMAFNEQ